MGFISLTLVFFQWFRDINREAVFEGMHTSLVQQGLRLGMILFILSEFLFFIGFF
jgi:heme/copper-type cytochrome/quinol oxidase subunit 3